MLVGLCLSPEQIRHYAESALNGLEDLEASDAIANARSDLTAMLAYVASLSPADDPVPILGLRVINSSRGLVALGRNAQIDDPAYLEIMRG